MATSSGYLSQQMDAINRQKILDLESTIEKLESKLKVSNLLAEGRRLTIERLQFQKHNYESIYSSNQCLSTKIKQILGSKPNVTTDEEILAEITTFKSSTGFWRRMYFQLYSQIESIGEELQISQLEEISDQKKDQTSRGIVRKSIKQIQNIKCLNTGLQQQIREKDNYCQTLIDLRDKLIHEIDSHKKENLRITKERDSLRDQCFYHNSMIKPFEDKKGVPTNSNTNSIDIIDKIHSLLNELKQQKRSDCYVDHNNSAVHPFETPDNSNNSIVLSTKTNGKRDSYLLRSGSKTTSNTHLSSDFVWLQKKARKETKPGNNRKLFDKSLS